MLAEEEKIRKDKEYCFYLFKEFKRKVLHEIAGMISIFNKDSKELSEEANSAIASRNRYDNDEAWSPFGFHKYPKKEVKFLVIRQVIDEESETGLSKKEILLFGNDKDKVERIRDIIYNFDDLVPNNYSGSKLPAKMVQMFLQYVGIGKGLEKDAVEYFFETYMENPSHSYERVSYQAVNGYKAEVENDRNGEYKSFVKSLQTRFCMITSYENASSF